MRAETIRNLAALAAELYGEHAEEFDDTRQNPWTGWKSLIEARPRSVLDAGCGNARFASALAGETRSFSYVGIDSSAPLLEKARRRLSTLGIASFDLLQRELTGAREALTDQKPAELVIAMGLLHHIPGRATREDLVKHLARLVAPNGTLAYSIWDSSAKKIVPWSERPNIDPTDLEDGDHLLRFGGKALRYCHAFDGAELDRLQAAAEGEGLELTSAYESDRYNRYFVFAQRRTPALS